MLTQIALKNIRFGHEAAKAVNARVAGRDDGIETLAANIKARGLIEPLIGVVAGELFFTSDGNRRLKALHAIHGKDSEVPIDVNVRDVDAAGAFEDSLTTAVLAVPLHPVDQYEAFAKLEQDDKSNDDIAAQYGLQLKQVRQALALGRLSPKIRDAWRKGEISADVAKAFTRASGHKAQDKVFDSLLKDNDLNTDAIRDAFGVKSDKEIGPLLEFVGADAYRAAGGEVSEDLFGTDHSVTKPGLLKELVSKKLDDRCAELLAAGWGWAKPLAHLPGAARNWPTKNLADKQLVYIDGEREAMDSIQRKLDAANLGTLDLSWQDEQELDAQLDRMKNEVRARSFSPAQRKNLGCILELDKGQLSITYGVDQPPAKPEPPAAKQTAGTTTAKAVSASAPMPAPKPQTTISNAMRERLAAQLMRATVDALHGEKAASPLAGILAAIVAIQIKPDRPSMIPHYVSEKLAAVRAEISPAVMNAAVLKRFDAKDYFGGAPKPVLLKSIGEAISADQARKLGDKTKADLAKFCNANLPKTGWLPKELRTPHYDGPGSGKKKETPKPKGAAKKAAKKRVK